MMAVRLADNADRMTGSQWKSRHICSSRRKVKENSSESEFARWLDAVER